METIANLLERAQLLETRHLECDRILATASKFAAERFRKSDGTGSIATFVDLELGAVGTADFLPHLVNTSSAISVISRNSSLLNELTVEAFSNLKSDDVVKFFFNHSNHMMVGATSSGWKSRHILQWSPYVTATALWALGDFVTTKSSHIGKTKELVDLLAEHAWGGSRCKFISDQAQKLVDFLETWAGKRLADELADYDHAFFAYVALEALASWTRAAKALNAGGLAVTHVPEVSDVNKKAVSRMLEVFYQQMTFVHPALRPHLDAASLGLAIYCLVRYGDSKPLSDDVLDLGIDAFFEAQQPTGYWDTVTPLLGAATGRVGCSSVELATRLLHVPRVVARFPDFSTKFGLLFAQLARGFDKDHPERGWSVDIRRNGTERQTWYGFFVYEFLNTYARAVRSASADLVLRGFRYSVPSPKRRWDELQLYPEIKDRVKRRVIDPRMQSPVSRLDPTMACSMILFGPPGTGKTSFASALAHQLSWGLIEIGPGDFLRRGIDNLFEQGDLIFERLLLLSRVVVLFDEIDEFVENRDVAEAEKITRFITTYMLPWVQRLRDKASIVFIFATNNFQAFDAAIRRPGRFDLMIPILFPSNCRSSLT